MTIRLRACAALLLFLSACATSAPSRKARLPPNPRIANLQRAAELPWTDGGRCVVREASQPWPLLAERCFQALDHDRVRFNDPTGRCTVASAGTMVLGTGLCILAAPEIVVGAVVVMGLVVVGVAIKEALDAYELSEDSSEEVEPAPQTNPALAEPSANRKPKLEPSVQDEFPPVPTEPMGRERRPECQPRRVNHRGGNDPHNTCADEVPNNSFPGWDVFVNGKNFDALQLTRRTLWEIKTDNFDTYSDFLRGRVVRDQAPKMRSERAIALACGFDFRVGVRSKAHQEALEDAAPDLKGIIVVMDWC